MKKIKYILPFIALLLFSCDDFLDVNSNPNSPLLNTVPPQSMLAAAQSNIYRTQATTMNQLGNVFTNNWAGNVNSFTGGFSKEYALTIDNSFYNGIWDNVYRGVANFQLIIDTPFENQENYIAIAKICKAHYMQTLVDLYGDLPYSEAFQGQANLTPAYDDDKAVYRALYDELDEAIATIDAAPANAVAVGTHDVMLGGDMIKWKKFANTIKLRMLLRQSQLTDAESVTYVADKFATLATADFVDFNVTINPGYSKSTASNQNPFFASYGYTPAGTATSNNSFVRASKFCADFLNFYVDPRGARLFIAPVVGAEQGNPVAPTTISPLGPGLITPPPSGTTDVSAGSAVNGYVMTASESYFLQAEALTRGFVIPGSASAKFNSGITSSMTLLGVTTAAANTYIANVATITGLGYTGTTDNKINAIMTQKWVALNGINAIQSYIDMTRTGYPVVPLALGAQYPTKPKRLIYPVSEYVANSAHVPNITQAQAFVEGPFWYVAP